MLLSLPHSEIIHQAGASLELVKQLVILNIERPGCSLLAGRKHFANIILDRFWGSVLGKCFGIVAQENDKIRWAILTQLLLGSSSGTSILNYPFRVLVALVLSAAQGDAVSHGAQCEIQWQHPPIWLSAFACQPVRTFDGNSAAQPASDNWLKGLAAHC